jgi:hypothetical protein
MGKTSEFISAMMAITITAMGVVAHVRLSPVGNVVVALRRKRILALIYAAMVLPLGNLVVMMGTRSMETGVTLIVMLKLGMLATLLQLTVKVIALKFVGIIIGTQLRVLVLNQSLHATMETQWMVMGAIGTVSKRQVLLAPQKLGNVLKFVEMDLLSMMNAMMEILWQEMDALHHVRSKLDTNA